MARPRRTPVQLLVADGEPAFADGVSEAFTEGEIAATAESVTSVGEAVTRVESGGDYDGVVVGDTLDDWIDVVEKCAEETTLAVVFVTDNINDPNTIATAATSGADSCLPRKQPDELHENIVDIVAASSRTDSGQPAPSALSEPETEPSGQPYRPVFENVTDGLVVQDPDTGRIIDVNERFCEMHGYDRDEILGESIDEVTAPDTKYSFESAGDLIEQAREGEPQLFEWRNQRKDGETFPVEVHLAVVRLHGSERVLASVRDITERRRREREYEQIFHAVQDAIIVMDPETLDILDANESYLDMVGYDDLAAIQEQGVEGLSVTTEGYTVEEGKRIHRRVAETGEPEVVEWQAETSEGERRWLEIKVAPAVIGGDEVNVTIHRDVTERRRTERRLRAIAEHIDEIVYLASADFSEILYINPAYEEMYGQSVEELSEDPTSFVEAAHPDDRDRYEADVERLIEDVEAGDPQDAYRGQYRIERDGETRWVTVTRFPIENEHGTVDRIVGRVQDITERKRREHEYEQIFNSVQGGITINDPETGELLDVNDSMCELLGYELEEIVELGVEGISASERGFTVDRSRELVEEVVETGEPRQFEWALETSDGETKWLDVRGTIAEIGGERRYLSLTRDITERRRSERRFRTISERIEEIIYLTNADLSEVYYVNSAYNDVFGRPVDELYEDAEAYFEAILPDDRTRFREAVDAMVEDIESGEPDDRYDFEYRIQRPDGEIRRLETTGYPVLTETDEPHQYVSITEDVTGQQTREQRLTVLNRILRHNVRNSLDVVLAHADHIDDTETAARIRESATDLLKLSTKAREAEEVMRESTGSPEPVDLADVANTVVDRYQTGDYTGDISVESPDNLVISSRRTVIRQVLAELVENALVHTDKDSPTVELRVSGSAEEAAEISVADDGPGLPEREQQILHSGTETQLKHGHGIGLWFVNWAVTQLGGDLQFRQNDPEGSIVTIRLYDVDGDRSATN